MPVISTFHAVCEGVLMWRWLGSSQSKGVPNRELESYSEGERRGLP